MAVTADALPLTTAESAPAGLPALLQSPVGRKLLLGVGASSVVAVMIAVSLWAQQPDYKVLFSNFSDRDGGAIVASLQQMNVPYKYSDGGSAILVPAEMVHDSRLKIAAQGLPKGGNVGFELMENQKLGVSQFLEQVNFQRALEGELAQSIQAVGAVQRARVHLAMPKASVFVRDQQKPTASVLLNLHQGRGLDKEQVSAIVHLIASSVPELPLKNVTVVDQDGNLLSDTERNKHSNGLDPTQLKYVDELQQSIVKRIESIVTPIVGINNVRAEATADVDFSRTEHAAEIYKPNQTRDTATVRSEQKSESGNGGTGASGVPGALTNQPPAPATAPLTQPESNPATAGGAGVQTQRDSTVNYEVDKTVRYVQQPQGGIKRLSVAVVVNYKKSLDKAGKLVTVPLTEAEKIQITDLVKEAMGFSKDRGDSVNVVNSPFAGVEMEKLPDVPLWKQPAMIELGMQAGKYLLAGIVLLYLFFAVLRPTLRKMTTPPAPANPAQLAGPANENDVDAVVSLSGGAAPQEGFTLAQPAYVSNLESAKQLARDDPKLVANVVKQWVGSNE